MTLKSSANNFSQKIISKMFITILEIWLAHDITWKAYTCMNKIHVYYNCSILILLCHQEMNEFHALYIQYLVANHFLLSLHSSYNSIFCWLWSTSLISLVSSCKYNLKTHRKIWKTLSRGSPFGLFMTVKKHLRTLNRIQGKKISF